MLPREHGNKPLEIMLPPHRRRLGSLVALYRKDRMAALGDTLKWLVGELVALMRDHKKQRDRNLLSGWQAQSLVTGHSFEERAVTCSHNACH